MTHSQQSIKQVLVGAVEGAAVTGHKNLEEIRAEQRQAVQGAEAPPPKPKRRAARRDPGTGSVYRQPGCKTWTISYYANGRRVREKTGRRDKQAAQQVLTQKLAKIADGTYVLPTRRPPVLVSGLWAAVERDYLNNQRKSLHSAQLRWKKHLASFFGDWQARNLGNADENGRTPIDRYVDDRREQGAKNASINRELAVLRRALRLGKVTPLPQFPHLKENNVRLGFVEDDAYAALTSRADALWLRCFLELAFVYGWRKTELLGMRVRQVDLKVRTIRLDPGTTKNEEGREVVMTDTVNALLKQAIAGKGPDDFVFTREDGSPVRDFRRVWQNICVRAGLGETICRKCGKPASGRKCECGSHELRYRGLIVHDLRRSAARAYRRAGIAESVIMKIGGWKTRQIFERYNVKDSKDIAEAVAAREERRMQQPATESEFSHGHDFGHDSPVSGNDAVPPGTAKVN